MATDDQLFAHFSDEDLLRHVKRLAALRNPATLGHYLDPSGYHLRAHTRYIGEALSRLGRDYDRLLITTPPQIGKPVHIGSLVLMGDGSRIPLRDVHTGHTVITHQGRPRQVTAIHEQGPRECVRITTESGRQTTAALDHPFLTPEGWTNAGDLTPGTVLATVPHPLTRPATNLNTEEAYLLGAFVGGGNLNGTSALITCRSPAVAQRLHTCAQTMGFVMAPSQSPSRRGTGTYRFRSRSRARADQEHGLRAWLAQHQLAGQNSHTKHIPPAVFTAPPEAISSFLAGYWDSDGCVSLRGADRHGAPRPDLRLEATSVSHTLISQVQHLLARLGVRTRIRTKTGAYGNPQHLSYRLTTPTRDDVARFRAAVPLVHEQKQQRLQASALPLTGFDPLFLPDPVVTVQPVGAQECRCLTVEEDHTFTADDLVVHNSTLTSQLFSFWWLARNPRHRIIIASYAASLAVKHSRAVRRMVIDHGREFGMALSKDAKAANDWSLNTGGGLRASGTSGSMTGFPANCISIDDPHKDRAEADSRKERDNVADWYSSTALSRLAPGAPVVLTLTRWHDDDLAARVLRNEPGRWHVVHLPALAIADDPMGRAPGEPLTHPVIPDDDVTALREHWTDKRATSTPRDWGALYMGDPKPAEGALVTREALARIRMQPGEQRPQPMRKAVAIDPNGGGRDTAGIVAGYLGEDRRLYLTHDRTLHGSSTEWSRAAALLAHETEAQVAFVEANYGGDMCTLALRTAWNALQNEGLIPQDALPPYIQAKRAKVGKLLRAEPIAQQILEGRIRLDGHFPELEEEWASWQPDDPDSPGRIDASVYLAYGMLPIPNSAEAIGSAAGVSLSAAAQSRSGGLGGIQIGRGGVGR